MICPKCGADNWSKVIDVRHILMTNTTRRRRICIECNHRFTTYEIISFEYIRERIKTNSRNRILDKLEI